MTTPDEAAFLRMIREHPDADLPRLVFADWLDENGQAERAEFIRVQCELDQFLTVDDWMRELPGYGGALRKRERYLFAVCGDEWFPGAMVFLTDALFAQEESPALLIRRGFPAEVRAPLAWLIGGECADCAGSPERVLFRGPGATNPYHWQCSRCHGTGRTPGHLPGLVAKWPITRVVVTQINNRPLAAPGYAGPGRHWLRVEPGRGFGDAHEIPPEIFDLMDLPFTRGHPTSRKTAPDENTALVALSDACLQWAKEQPE